MTRALYALAIIPFIALMAHPQNAGEAHHIEQREEVVVPEESEPDSIPPSDTMEYLEPPPEPDGVYLICLEDCPLIPEPEHLHATSSE